MYLYLYLGTVFQVPVPDPHEQEVPVPGGKVHKKSGTTQVHVRYVYEILNIILYWILNIHTNQVSEF